MDSSMARPLSWAYYFFSPGSAAVMQTFHFPQHEPLLSPGVQKSPGQRTCSTLLGPFQSVYSYIQKKFPKVSEPLLCSIMFLCSLPVKTFSNCTTILCYGVVVPHFSPRIGSLLPVRQWGIQSQNPNVPLFLGHSCYHCASWVLWEVNRDRNRSIKSLLGNNTRERKRQGPRLGRNGWQTTMQIRQRPWKPNRKVHAEDYLVKKPCVGQKSQPCSTSCLVISQSRPKKSMAWAQKLRPAWKS